MSANDAGFVIRDMRESDIPELSRFGARVFEETFRDDPDHDPQNMAMFLEQVYSTAALRGEFADPLLTFLLACTSAAIPFGDSIIGYAKVRRGEAPPCVAGDRPIELGQLYIDFAWHGRGVAHALMERAVDLARAEKFRTMWLGVWHRNSRAQKFYRKWGFERVGQYPFQFGRMNQKDEVFARAV